MEFPTPTKIDGDFHIDPAITTDGKVMYAGNLSSGRLSRFDRMGAGFGPAQGVQLGSLASSVVSPVTNDDLTLFMSLGDTVGSDIHVTKRAAVTSPWPTPTQVSELKLAAGLAEPSWLSPDGCRLYVTYQMGTDKSRIYVATRPK